MRSKRILVVDDDRGMRHSVLRLLQREGYEVYGADSGEDAVRQVKVHHPDLILMDVVMPGIGGIEAARQIKSDPAVDDVFIVHLSAQKADATRRMEGLNAGADGYISQPVENEELLARIRAFLRHKDSLDALRSSEARYRALYERNRLPMWIYDVATFAVLDVNDAAVFHLGYAREEFVGKSLAELIVAEDRNEFLAALRDSGPSSGQECWRYLKKNKVVVEAEAIEQDLFWNGRAARALVLFDVTARNQIERENRVMIDRYEREVRSLKSVSEFRRDNGAASIHRATTQPLAERLDAFSQRYIKLVERALEQKIYKVDHDVSSELQRLASDLFTLTASPRDVVELHCAAMQRAVPDPTAPRAQGLLESGRLVVVELMGYVLAAYRNFFLEQRSVRH